MTTSAALYVPEAEDARTALLVVAGRPVAFRVMMAAIRAGVREVAVPEVFRGTALEKAIAMTPSARAAAVWLTETSVPPDGPVLLLPASSLAPAPAIARLLEATAPASLRESLDGGAPLALVSAIVMDKLWAGLVAGAPLGESIGQLLTAPETVSVGGAPWCIRVSSRADAGRAETLLYRTLGSPIDTWLDRALHRRLSRAVSTRAVRWRLTPNQLTLASLAVGAGAVWSFWNATAVSAAAGLVLYLVSVVLDHADGEVARLALAESRLGEWLDLAADTIVHAAVMLAIGVTASGSVGPAGVLLGVVAAGGVVASAWQAKISPARATPRGTGSLLHSLGSRDTFYGLLVLYLVVLAVAPRLLPALALVVAVGSHAYWLGRLAHRLAGRSFHASRPAPPPLAVPRPDPGQPSRRRAGAPPSTVRNPK
jgi:phosphatidylglycerophosphate synthase